MVDAIFDQALRFHVRIDHEGRIVHLGPSLVRLLPKAIGVELRSIARTSDLGSDMDMPMSQWPGRLVQLTFEQPRFTLRGEFLSGTCTTDGLVFAATLDPDDVDRLGELGLSASDFARSDLSMEFLMLKWTRDSQIAETKSALARLEQSIKLGESLRLRASTDSLTGIANRGKFIEELDLALANSTPGAGELAVIMIDVDRFKSINDVHGHHVGDQVLVSVAGNLTRTVGADGLVARIGGDEFAILVTGPDTETEVHRLCNAIVAHSGGRFHHDGGVATVGLSLGIAVHGRETNSGELLRHADVAMYATRRTRSGAIGVFDPAAQRDLDLRRSIADDLLAALESNDIELYFQPMVEMETRRTWAFEVLSRWDHPTHGPIPPDLFIDVAEHYQIAQELDRYVVRKALTLAREHLMLDGELPRLSVNFSALSLTGDLACYLDGLFSELDFSPSKLGVEVTETASIADMERTGRILHDLAEMGIKIALDDFGTGYSSLTYLHRLPIGGLKIDRSFVNGMLDSQKTLEVVRSILQVAASLNMPVVAEGVETPEEYVRLSSLGCSYGQGYYFSKPVPVLEARRTLGKKLPLRKPRPEIAPTLIASEQQT